MNQVLRLKRWLERHECQDVRPVKVTFGTPRKSVTEVFEGCVYRRVLTYKAGMMAVTHGEAKVGDTYTECSCYLLGERPAAKQPKKNRRHDKTCFHHVSGVDWYVACYIEAAAITPRISASHPFGPSFIITPWTHVDKIDAGEFKRRRHVPYSRFPIGFDIDMTEYEQAENYAQTNHPQTAPNQSRLADA